MSSGSIGSVAFYPNKSIYVAEAGRNGQLDSKLVRACDIAISLACIIFLMPAFLLISALIYLQDGGPVFFVQSRIGRGGKEFKCFKFRSMRENGDAVLRQYLADNPEERQRWAIYHKVDFDPRVTGIGRIIRKTSLDEFPQLLNVLKGEMSIVGPRPILRNEVAKYGTSYRVYTSMLPGITGLWQVCGRNKLTYLKRVALDRLLSKKYSILFYLSILLLTVPAVLFQRGAR